MEKQKKNKTSNKKNAGYNKTKYNEFIAYAESIAFRNFFYEDKKIKGIIELLKRIDKVLPYKISRETKYDYIRIYSNTDAGKQTSYDTFLSIVKKKKLRSILKEYTDGYSYFNITRQENYIVGLFVFKGAKKVFIDIFKDVYADLFFSVHEGTSSLILVFDSVEKEKEFKDYIDDSDNEEIK